MTSELSLSDFYPDGKEIEAECRAEASSPPEETIQKTEVKPAEETLPNDTNFDTGSQKYTAAEIADIETVKECLDKAQTYDQIAQRLNCTRVTVSRKIAKWMQTPDFDQWINTRWLKHNLELSQNEETKLEVFKQETRLLIAKLSKKLDITAKADVTEKIEADVTVKTSLLAEYEAILTREAENQKES
jgi:hypothetical protein